MLQKSSLQPTGYYPGFSVPDPKVTHTSFARKKQPEQANPDGGGCVIPFTYLGFRLEWGTEEVNAAFGVSSPNPAAAGSPTPMHSASPPSP